MARESYNEGRDEEGDSYTWSFYTLSTIVGSVNIRFYGTSNGYYSEEATLIKIRELKEKPKILIFRR